MKSINDFNVILIMEEKKERECSIYCLSWVKTKEIPICYKRIIARRDEQVNAAKERYGFLEASLDFNDLINDPEIVNSISR